MDILPAVVISRSAERFGFPRLRGLGRLAGSAGVESLGSGMFLPFTIPYFLAVTDLGLVAIGTALSIAALAGVPAGVLSGPLVDRFGAPAVIVGCNLLRCLGFVSYLWVETPWQLVLAAALIYWADGAWLPAQGTLVVSLVGIEQQPRWFGLIRSARNASLGVGAMIAAAVVGFGDIGYHALAVTNAVIYLFVALLIGTWPKAHALAGRRAAVARPRATGGYLRVLRDRPFTLLVVANAFFVVAVYAIILLVPAFVGVTMPAHAWLPGALYTVNTVLVVVAQPPVVRWTEKRAETGVLRLASVLWAVSFLVLGASALLPPPAALVMLFLGIVVFTSAELLFAPTSSAFAARLAPEEMRGRYLGVHQMSWGVAMVVAPVLFTSLLARGPVWPWPVLVACCAVAWLAVGGARSHGTRRESAAA
ncbi:MFS transporter [Actinoalloteichus caeruleus]|uniref:Major Facilitator Superfamily protein n=1 Tax=Actinoalloteichus caeruleus DSM 43889 TaxID=1120930 RepID=A0ABT1JD52_ACTCY|nr:MFS transporter [Actinoalloteichus caeruleus]MCP2330214.1 Major Facilitator Superfamily protein [Actinoalloteichus caeruleus DSM 43889]